MKTQFEPDCWHGSFYELSIQLSSTPNIDRINQTLKAIFHKNNNIKGPFISNCNLDTITDLNVLNITDVTILYGLVSIEHDDFGLVIDIVREVQNDWISISFPTGMIERIFAVKYPLYTETNKWIHTIDRFFIELCKSISSSVEFEMALIGEEVSGYVSENEVTKEIIKKGGIIVKDCTYKRMKSNCKIQELGNGLLYIPPIEMLNITYGRNPTTAST